jgi:hypothetical protein
MYDKHAIEECARRSLAVICGYPIENIQRKDKPDLQDELHSYGIEVVEDCCQNEREAERFVRSVWNKSCAEIAQDKIERLRKLGGSLREENGLVSGATLGSAANSPDHLIKTIRRKIEKLNGGGYKEFDAYGLYVMTDTVPLFDSYVQSTIEAVGEYQAGRERWFATIYLDGYYEMCICDMQERTFIRKAISREDRDIIWAQGNEAQCPQEE